MSIKPFLRFNWCVERLSARFSCLFHPSNLIPCPSGSTNSQPITLLSEWKKNDYQHFKKRAKQEVFDSTLTVLYLSCLIPPSGQALLCVLWQKKEGNSTCTGQLIHGSLRNTSYFLTFLDLWTQKVRYERKITKVLLCGTCPPHFFPFVPKPLFRGSSTSLAEKRGMSVILFVMAIQGGSNKRWYGPHE